MVIGPADPTVGLRELRHNTREVISRVQRGEAVDITDHGRLIARIVPAGDRSPTSVMTSLIETGRVTRASRPGHRPLMRQGDGTDRLGAALAELRREEDR